MILNLQRFNFFNKIYNWVAAFRVIEGECFEDWCQMFVEDFKKSMSNVCGGFQS